MKTKKLIEFFSKKKPTDTPPPLTAVDDDENDPVPDLTVPSDAESTENGSKKIKIKKLRKISKFFRRQKNSSNSEAKSEEKSPTLQIEKESQELKELFQSPKPTQTREVKIETKDQPKQEVKQEKEIKQKVEKETETKDQTQQEAKREPETKTDEIKQQEVQRERKIKVENTDEPRRKSSARSPFSGRKSSADRKSPETKEEKKDPLEDKSPEFKILRDSKPCEYPIFEKYSSQNHIDNLYNIFRFWSSKELLETETKEEQIKPSIEKAEALKYLKTEFKKNKNAKYNFPEEKSPIEKGRCEYVIGDIHGDMNHYLMNMIGSGIARFKENQPLYKMFDTYSLQTVDKFEPGLTSDEIWKRYRMIPNLELNPDFKDSVNIVGDIIDRGIYSDEIFYSLLDLCNQERKSYQKAEREPQENQEDYVKNKKLSVVLGDHDIYASTLYEKSPCSIDYSSTIDGLLNRGGKEAMGNAIMSAIHNQILETAHIGKSGITYIHACIGIEFLTDLQAELREGLRPKNALDQGRVIISRAGRSEEDLKKVRESIEYFINLSKNSDNKTSPEKPDFDPKSDYQKYSRILIDHLNIIARNTVSNKSTIARTGIETFTLRYTIPEDSFDSEHSLYNFKTGPFGFRGKPIPFIMAIGHNNQKDHKLAHISEARVVQDCKDSKDVPILVFDLQASSYYTDYQDFSSSSYASESRIKDDGSTESRFFPKYKEIFKNGIISPKAINNLQIIESKETKDKRGDFILVKEIEEKGRFSKSFTAYKPSDLKNQELHILIPKITNPAVSKRILEIIRSQDSLENLELYKTVGDQKILTTFAIPISVDFSTKYLTGNILHLACLTDNLALIKELLEHQTIRQQINQTNELGQTPLYCAMLKNNKNPDLVNLLLEHGADPKSVGGTSVKEIFPADEEERESKNPRCKPYHQSINQIRQKAEMLQSYEWKFYELIETPISSPSQKEAIDLKLSELIQNNKINLMAKFSDRNLSPLMLAIIHDYPKTMNMILENTNPIILKQLTKQESKSKSIAIDYAIRYGRYNMIEKLGKLNLSVFVSEKTGEVIEASYPKAKGVSDDNYYKTLGIVNALVKLKTKDKKKDLSTSTSITPTQTALTPKRRSSSTATPKNSESKTPETKTDDQTKPTTPRKPSSSQKPKQNSTKPMTPKSQNEQGQ